MSLLNAVIAIKHPKVNRFMIFCKIFYYIVLHFGFILLKTNVGTCCIPK